MSTTIPGIFLYYCSIFFTIMEKSVDINIIIS